MSLLGTAEVGTELGKAAGGVISAIGSVFDELFTSDEERAQGQLLLEKMRQKPHLLQALTNMKEAAHRSVFVAGWRPFIGWVCGVALFWHFMLSDVVEWVCLVWFPHIQPPELTGTGDLISLVIALLGLGGLRTFEKYTGKAK